MKKLLLGYLIIGSAGLVIYILSLNPLLFFKIACGIILIIILSALAYALGNEILEKKNEI